MGATWPGGRRLNLTPTRGAHNLGAVPVRDGRSAASEVMAMKGLMQEHPLNIPMIVRHAEQLNRKKTVTTRTDGGVDVRTFGEVIDRSRRLISALRELGVKEDDRVGTFSWNTHQHLETYVAVPCMGAILHTLNIRLFTKDLVYIVEHAGDKVVVVDKSLWPAWEKVAAEVKGVEHVIVVNDTPGPIPDGTIDFEELIAQHDPGELVEVPEGNACAMCYTSGTTGNPKGVVYSHRSNVLHSYMASSVDSIGPCEADVALPIVPMFHANAWGIPYAALMTGADLVMPARFMVPDALTGLMADQKVTLGFGVPTIWLGMLEPLKAVKDKLGSLNRIVCGGSAVPPALQQAYHRDLGVRIIHAWGMTETNPLASMCRPLAAHAALGADDLDQVLTSQGRVLPGVEIRIADDDGRALPWDGQSVGEIQVRGNWIAADYYNDPTSTAKFIDGWLRTGDVATIDDDGYIRITDRTKDLVKSGGEWISSVELEGKIMAHPDVAEAAVIAIADPKWDERPLACVVPKPEAKDTLTKEAIIEHLRPLVAKWWLPDDVVFIDEVPKTSVGKFDKKVLRDRFKDHRMPDIAHEHAAEPAAAKT
jgi:fatty-acyl-CoA synthase